MTYYILCAIIVFLILMVGMGIKRFNNTVEKEKAILFDLNKKWSEKITEKDLDPLPTLLKNYLIKVKIIGKPKHCHVTFKQKGKIKTGTRKGWLPFVAKQHMSWVNSGFIWKAKSFPVLVRDKYLEQQGEVLVSLLGVKKISQNNSTEIDQSSLGRYFGELIWFPIGFLDPDIIWDTIDHKTVKGLITKGKQSLEAYFYFNNEGMIESFKTKRYRNHFLENFIGKTGNYKNFDGIMVPDKMVAIWDLKDQYLEYFNSEIIDYKLEH